ncbi:MAG: undecaprenyl/decaprenyl-phosphate alpha-N-acetylglucosaminyl 1-phosphate transferase [Candidatus Schekmanbacteria bacterium]|nr:MAG: undecaprenyl/decaprenyl-phosphate alpha-N-acetylglucosaminyl 1-phosphate transferase [Candidatus Schekmanbacteria bacterium]
MIYLLLIFSFALIFSLALMPIAERLGHKTGIINAPSSDRLSKKAIPLLGGAAIYISFFLALLIFGKQFRIHQLIGIIVGATIISFFGLYDDWREISASFKFFGQVIPVVILIATGIKVEIFRNDILNIFVTMLWVIGITNSINLLDNMDGIAGGVSAISSLFFFVLSTLNGQYLVASLSAAIVGVCLGFLKYNLNPARIFMGDTGALFLGFILSVLGIKLRFPRIPYIYTWMIPIVILAYPIMDTTLVTISRLRRGVNPFTTPGTDHSTHRLCLLGLSHKQVALSVYCLSAFFGILSIAIFNFPGVVGYSIFFATLLIIAVMIFYFEWIYSKNNRLKS